MKLQEIINQGFTICGWNIKNDPRGERRVVFKLVKKTPRGKKFYVVHTPQLDTTLKSITELHNMEFTEPVLLK
jgi:hypothetical protein